uniref:Uncharacterized protein n=1 Tax=Arundo donax TaxID=35708 RepID=A0A0A9EIW0_ARUDO
MQKHNQTSEQILWIGDFIRGIKFSIEWVCLCQFMPTQFSYAFAHRSYCTCILLRDYQLQDKWP